MSTLPKDDSMPSKGAIRIEDVVKVYDPDGAAVMAVDHCSIDIPAGEICMIVGPSGCGKTTLLNAEQNLFTHTERPTTIAKYQYQYAVTANAVTQERSST